MINIGICGYGKLGKAVATIIGESKMYNLIGIFTKRDPNSIDNTNPLLFNVKKILDFKDNIDVLLMCGSSKNDLTKESVIFSRHFNIVDTYDTQGLIGLHYEKVNKALLKSNKIGLISIGWKTGLFSLNRMLIKSILPNSYTSTFLGKGVSQSHSNAIRKIKGVIDATCYIICNSDLLHKSRTGQKIDNNVHLKECYVVINDDLLKEQIKKEIVSMPNYFLGSKTIIKFVSLEELQDEHKKMLHKGVVVTTDNYSKIEYSLNLDSNPKFTASIILCYAKAIYKMYKIGFTGCKTIFDIPPIYLTDLNTKELIKTFM